MFAIIVHKGSEIMAKTIIIGSTTADLIIHVPYLPKSTEDLNIQKQQMQLGGCAYNISHMHHLFHLSYTLCTPEGTGPFGEFIKQELASRNIELPIKTSRECGVCICSIEDNGERTFMAYHGVEYDFNKEWMNQVDISDANAVYICGLEIEETNGDQIIEYLTQHKEWQVYFAPGPRLLHIPSEKMERIFDLSPVIHLNEKEAISYTKTSSIEEACKYINAKTNNDVIVTLSEKGAYLYCDNHGKIYPGYPAVVADTVGAGDSHFGSYISAVNLGYKKEIAVDLANYIAAKVVSITGASLSQEQFTEIYDDYKKLND